MSQPFRTPDRRRPSTYWLTMCLIAFLPALIFTLLPLGLLDTFEGSAYDARMRLRNRIHPLAMDPRIVVVGIADADAQLLGPDLTSRQAHGEVLGLLRQWKAAVVAFDLFFLDELPSDDLFALSIAQAGMPVVLGYYFLEDDAPEPLSAPVDERLAEVAGGIAKSTDTGWLANTARELRDSEVELEQLMVDVRRGRVEATDAERVDGVRLLAWTRIVRGRALRKWFALNAGTVAGEGSGVPKMGNLRLLSQTIMLSGAGLGFTNLEKGTEDVVRRAPLLLRLGNRWFPGLSLRTAMAWYGTDKFTIKPGSIELGDVRIPIDDAGRMLVSFRGGEEWLRRNPTVSALLLDAAKPGVPGGDPSKFFAGKIVIVGETMTGGAATDVEGIPLQPSYPMVGLHANVLNTIVCRDFIREIHPLIYLFVLFIFCSVYLVSFHMLNFPRASLVAIIIFVIFVFLNFELFSHGWLIPLVKPMLALVTSLTLFFGYLVLVREREERAIRDVFLKSVSPRLGEEILRRYGDPELLASRRMVTVLFLDVRGYTQMSDTHSPEEILVLIERFYDVASAAVFANDGQVNKFLGDGVLALFGALREEPPNHAERALRAAAELQRTLGGVGAGIATGETTVGIVGTKRIEYAALGDAVNVASRLQGIANSGEILLGDSSRREIPDRLFAELNLTHLGSEDVLLKGKSAPVPVHRYVARDTRGA